MKNLSDKIRNNRNLMEIIIKYFIIYIISVTFSFSSIYHIEDYIISFYQGESIENFSFNLR